jgi:hypothetical protein
MRNFKYAENLLRDLAARVLMMMMMMMGNGIQRDGCGRKPNTQEDSTTTGPYPRLRMLSTE